MVVLYSVLWLLAICYAVSVLFAWKLWNHIPDLQTKRSQSFRTRVSVIIPVRNEEIGIVALLKDLAQQDYPFSLMEVVVVDDNSTDQTATLVEHFHTRSTLPIRLLRLDEQRSTSPKKRAITTAIATCHSELIITTDGDCRVGPSWISSFVHQYEQTHAQLISGPVTFTNEHLLTDYLQTVEFSSLIGTGAACIQAGYPTMCNGANLAYTRKAFEEVQGFNGFTQIASGDDEFLLHKIKQRYPQSIAFLKTADAIVQTTPHTTWQGFYHQRKRWASKWTLYRSMTPKIMAAFVFFSNTILPFTFFLSLLDWLPWGITMAIWLVKCLPEWLFISTLLRFLKKSYCIPLIPLVQVLYPWYVLLFGLSNNSSKSYIWKGRELQ